MPVLLFCDTLQYARKYNSIEGVGLRILLNVFLATGIIITIADTQLSTLMATAVAGYALVVGVIGVIACWQLAMRAKSYFSARSQVRQIEPVDTEDSVLQSTFQY